MLYYTTWAGWWHDDTIHCWIAINTRGEKLASYTCELVNNVREINKSILKAAHEEAEMYAPGWMLS